MATIQKPDKKVRFLTGFNKMAAILAILPFDSRTQKVSRDGHSNAGQSGFRMYTVYH
jgi:hypothetical protein